ncbi:hypothetical protein KXQ82_13010 [Mucilaginibacter sp. HMF5004]|uniref:hypothetical protein n=1 Tax=Mucilaginibacter rivuli TaxID=2857527 RepID=UPI001C5FE844|nr:hypothetical protein [Mucilaginibacter rivuli]MBW4890648.1 hypothetical protein [Mucilaginibacter rivuli]
MKYLVTLLFIVACRPLTGLAFAGAVSNEKGIYLLTDTGQATSVKKQSVSAGVNYGTNASFFGRTSPVTYPYLTTDVIYNTKFGLFVYGSAWKVIGSPPAFDEFDVGGGYNYKLNNDIKGTISYTHFSFNDKAQIIKSASSNDINFKNSFDWHLLKTSITADYLFGKSNDFFLSIGHSHYFESNFNIFDEKDYITFEPSFNMIFGTQNFVEYFSNQHGFFDYKEDPNKPHGIQPLPNDYSVKNTQFNPLNYNFRFPLAYNRPHYTVEAAYKYSIPVNVQGSLFNANTSFFNLTFYYLFY